MLSLLKMAFHSFSDSQAACKYCFTAKHRESVFFCKPLLKRFCGKMQGFNQKRSIFLRL